MESTDKKASLGKNIYWSFLGNVVYAACQWAMLTVIAKLTDASAVGQFAFGLAVTAPIYSFSNLQLRSIQATDVRGEFTFEEYFRFRLMATVVATICVVPFGLSSDGDWSSGAVLYWVAASKAIESMSDVIYGLLQKHEQMDRIAQSLIFKGLLSVAALSGTMLVTRSVVWGTVSMALSWGIILLVFDLRVAKVVSGKTFLGMIRGGYSMEWRSYGRLFWLALPMGFVIALNTLYPNIPRYFVTEYWGDEKLGYFSAIGYVVIAGTTVVNAVGQAATPRLAAFFVSDQRQFFRLLTQITLVALGVGVVGIGIVAGWGERILSLLYTEAYAAYGDVLIWTMVGGSLLYGSACLGCGLTAARAFGVQASVAFVTTTAVVAFSLINIPTDGLVGAAKALAGAYIIRSVLIAVSVVELSRRKHQIKH
jgi:O-antigen/teichoic acid export membrane protein